MVQKMEGTSDVVRKRGEEYEDDEEDQFEDEELMRESKRKWWKRVYSLMMKSDQSGEGSINHRLRRDIVVRNGSTVSSPLDRLVIHPDNWYDSSLELDN